MGLLDFIFPKRCVGCGEFGTYLCSKDQKKIKPATFLCPVCSKPAIGGTTHPKCKGKLSLDGLVCFFDYQTPLRELIHELKYRFSQDLVSTLVREIKKTPVFKETDFTGFTLVPIPLSRGRENWRGFNQAEVLGRRLAFQLGIGFEPRLLRKIKETKPQAKLPKKERLRQAKGVFKVERELKGENFLLFDDVWTTGATMKAATAALKRRGANKVWGMVLARSC